MVNKLTNTVKPLDEVDKINEIIDALDDKQDALVSGTNIKTINSNSILGSGNLTLDGLPSQTGNANKFLTTDGTDASWAAVPSRNIGEIVESTVPLTDAGLHLLDGALIQGNGIYSAFVTHIAELYNADPTANYFVQAGDVSWTQPILSSNGTMGGNSFAVSSNVVQLSGNNVWCAFDGVTSGGNYFHSQSGTKTGYIDIYNPVPIKITNFKIYNQDGSANRASSAGVIYGSDNGSDWTQLSTYTNSVQTAGGTWNIDLSSNENYYKYYRMESTTGGSDSYWVINEVEITATYYLTAEELWQTSVTNYGVCGKFVYDSVNNTVRLPKITGIIEGTTDVTALGDLVEAGLPSVEHKHYNGVVDDGANIWRVTNQWGREGCSNGGSNSTTGYTSGVVDVESSIYGKSNTVQPQTIKAFYYIVIATSTKTDIQVDIDEIATDLNSKADVDLTNVPSSKAILQESYVNGTSWYRVYSDGWCEQGGELTSVPTDTTVTVSLLKPYANTNYSVLIVATGGSRNSGQYMNGESVQSRSVDSFVMLTQDYTFGRIWRAEGYIR